MTKILGEDNINRNNDKKICLALTAHFLILTIQYFILISLNLLDTSQGSIIQIISKIIVGMIFIYALPGVLKSNKVKFVGVYFIAIFIFLLNYLMFPENRVHLEGIIFPLFFMALPAFIYSMSIKDWGILKETMIKVAYIVLIFGTILGIFIIFGEASVGIYSMSLSYYMLFPSILLLNKLLDNYSIRTFFLWLISLSVILALGSRGAILCIIVFLILKLIRFDSSNKYFKIYNRFIIITTIVPMFIYLDKIVEFFYNFFLKFGINSRTLRLFGTEEIYLSGRNNIYNSLITAISENPILGLGLGADRNFTETGYAHNFFLEVLINFGVVFGGIILIVILFFIIKSLKTKNIEKYNMIIIWFGVGFIPLMVSSSYLININFWIFLGIMFNSFKVNNEYYLKRE